VGLVVEGIGVDYGGGEVVRGVDLQVGPGEFIALIGPNGAGKTSTLRAIVGLAPRSRGSVVHDGTHLEKKSPDFHTRAGLVMVPEDRGLFSQMTVHDHLWLGSHKRPRPGDLDEVWQLFPQLESRVKQPAGALSGGEAQMLAIATALLLRPKILFIDELSFGLAPIIVSELLKFVDLVLDVADRAIVMTHGEVRATGSASEIRSNPEALREAYLG
jgi:branched-chain amino acid transport system ATP-binding protein